jgi:hypothetical protein
MDSLLIYVLLTPALFYLGSRATITQWLWGRYPPKLAQFMDCSACSGFWYGLLASVVLRLPVTGVDLDPGIFSPVHLLVGLCAIVWTPIVGGIMQAGFERLGSVVGADEDDDGA